MWKGCQPLELATHGNAGVTIPRTFQKYMDVALGNMLQYAGLMVEIDDIKGLFPS